MLTRSSQSYTGLPTSLSPDRSLFLMSPDMGLLKRYTAGRGLGFRSA
jgi:hypothetical protein